MINPHDQDIFKKDLTEEEIDQLIEQAAEKRDDGDREEATFIYLITLTAINKTTDLTNDKKKDKTKEVIDLSLLMMNNRRQSP